MSFVFCVFVPQFRLKRCGLRRPIYLVEGGGASASHLSLPEATLQQAIVNTQVQMWNSSFRSVAADGPSHVVVSPAGGGRVLREEGPGRAGVGRLPDHHDATPDLSLPGPAEPCAGLCACEEPDVN